MNIILADGIICDRNEMAKVFPYTRLLGLPVVLCSGMRERLPYSGQGHRDFREPPAPYMSSHMHHDSHTRQGGWFFTVKQDEHYECTVQGRGPSHNNLLVQPDDSMPPILDHLVNMGIRPR